jgi:hypothetical protein
MLILISLRAIWILLRWPWILLAPSLAFVAMGLDFRRNPTLPIAATRSSDQVTVSAL